MKKEKLFCQEYFDVADADLLVEFLQTKAAEGWKYVKGRPGRGRMEFVKADPEERFYQWECLPHDEKGSAARRIQRGTIERQRNNGWRHEGTYGPLLLFSSEEERKFEHWGGAIGRNDNIFGWLKKGKRRLLVNTLLYGSLLVFLLSQLFVFVQVEEYLEWGFSGAFCLLYDNTSIVFFLMILTAFLLYLVNFVQQPSVQRGKESVEEAIISGRKVFYGEAQEYEKRKKKKRAVAIGSWIVIAIFLAAFWLTTFAVSTVPETILLMILFAVAFLLIVAIRKTASHRKWGGVKHFVVLFCAVMILIIVGVPAIMAIDDVWFDAEAADEWKAIEEEYTYPPSRFGINSHEDMQWTAEKMGSVFGTYESLDVYHQEYDEENPFDYNYHKYTAYADFFADILKKQALENLEPYRAEPISGLAGGWTGYRISWNTDTEQWFYTDTIVLMKGREIILANCYLENIPMEKVLEIFLSNSPLLMI